MRANMYEQRLKPEAPGTEAFFSGRVLTIWGSKTGLLGCAEASSLAPSIYCSAIWQEASASGDV
jgi:hypothetical protein